MKRKEQNMSASYYASAVVGIILPIKDKDLQYEVEKRGCEHDVPENAKFCPYCGKSKTEIIIKKIDSYELETIINKTYLKYAYTTDQLDIAIGDKTVECNLNYGSPTASIEIPNLAFINKELIKVRDDLQKHPELSKTSLPESFQKAMGEGIKVHVVGFRTIQFNQLLILIGDK